MLQGFLGRLDCRFAEKTADLVPLFPQIGIAASSSPYCAHLMRSVTGCARPMGRLARGRAVSATTAKGSFAPSLRRRPSPRHRACCSARAHPPTRAVGSAGATPLHPAACYPLRPPTAWSCVNNACPSHCAGTSARRGGRGGRVGATPSSPPSCAKMVLTPPGTVDRLQHVATLNTF